MASRRTADSGLAKTINSRLVLDCITRYNSLSRADIAKLTSLSPSTVSSIVADLLSAGILSEGQEVVTSGGTGGRRPVALTLNASASHVITVSIQVNRILSHVVDLSCNACCVFSEPTDLRSPEHTIEQVMQIAARTRAKIPREANLTGFGISVPGIVDTSTGTVIRSNPLKWTNLPLSDMLKREFAMPVLVERDVRAAGWGERLHGAGRHADNFAYLSVGEGGYGAGLILGGMPYLGSSMYAGELGHITVDMNADKCTCGNIGCLAHIAAPFMSQTHTPSGLAKVVECTAAGIVNLVNLLDPELVILGGDMVEEHQGFVAMVEEVVSQRANLVPGGHLRLVESALGETGTAIGLAGLVFDEFYWNRVFPNARVLA